jgi:hypothetical protein
MSSHNRFLIVVAVVIASLLAVLTIERYNECLQSAGRNCNHGLGSAPTLPKVK